MAPLFPRSGPGVSQFPDVSSTIEVLRLPVTHPRSLICFASRVHTALLGSCLAAFARAPGRSEGLPGQGQCSTGDPIAGVLSRGRERDLSGSQAIRPVPLPRSKTPTGPTISRLLTVSSVLPPLLRQRRLQRENHIGAWACFGGDPFSERTGRSTHRQWHTLRIGGRRLDFQSRPIAAFSSQHPFRSGLREQLRSGRWRRVAPLAE